MLLCGPDMALINHRPATFIHKGNGLARYRDASYSGFQQAD
jgi:hypothetical protein